MHQGNEEKLYRDPDLEDEEIDEEDDLDEEDDEIGEEDAAARSEAAEELGAGDDAAEELFDDGEYLMVPRIPDQYKASDVIGKRTQASSASTAIKMGEIKPKAKLRAIWNGMTDVEKYILMLISEHRHLTQAQLGVLLVTPTRLRQKKGAINNTKAYFKWVTDTKYECHLNYKNTFKTSTHNGLSLKLRHMCDDGLLEEITPAYAVDERNISKRYQETPSLYTQHYYLTPLGAKVLVCNTAANRNTANEKPVGFVPTYKHAAFQTILHEAECTEILCSIISCAQYATNPDDGKEYGLFDICRFYHEKDVEEKNVVYNGKKIDFKSDGKLTMYVEEYGDFIDWYIEYDSGSSTPSKITHKTEAFIKYIFWKRERYGDRFRKPVLLLATQKPADLFPQLTGRKFTKYTTGIKKMSHQYFSEYLDFINDIAVVLVADCGSIRAHGALGACWHKVDLTTGIADEKAYDLITASRGIVK